MSAILELPNYICKECGFMLRARIRRQGRKTVIVQHCDNVCENAGKVWEVTPHESEAEEL